MLGYVLNPTGDSYEVFKTNDNSAEKIIIPDMYNGLPVTSVRASFENCTNLKELVVGNNVEKTYFGVFNCASLEKIYFGRSIETISGPFTVCENLTDIYFSFGEEEWENINFVAIDESFEIFQNARRHFGVLGRSGYLTKEDEILFPYTHWNCLKGIPEKIDSEIISYDNTVSGIKSDNVKDAIDELSARDFDVSALESWDELLYLVRSGRAAEFIKTGDRFVCMKNGQELVWEVIGIDKDTPADEKIKHSLTLQLSECYANMPFSVPDATCYLYATLAPGQYYVKLKNYASPDVYCAFTVEEKINSGTIVRVSDGKVYFYRTNTELPYLTIDADFYSEDESEMTGTKIDTDAYKINSEMGTVNYEESVVRQWLNSSETRWWKSSSLRRLAPLDYIATPGFMNGMDEDFLNAINPVKKTTILPDGTTVETNDKFFLLSSEEVYGGGENYYPYYSENSSLSAPGNAVDAIRIKNFSGAARHWWLRNSAEGDNGYLRVLTDGGIGAVKAAKVLAYGVVPACCVC